MPFETKEVKEIRDPILVVERIPAKYGEIVKIKTEKGERKGRVIGITKDLLLIESLEGTAGIGKTSTTIETTGQLATFPVSVDVIGRFLSGDGKPLDEKNEILGEEREISGFPINPILREIPSHFIETGISVIDGLASIMLGQKIAIFSGVGMPHYKLAAQLVKQIEVRGKEFVVFLVGLGLTNDIFEFFMKEFKGKELMKRSTIFLNRAEDPIVQRIIAPRIALTSAEYLAFDEGFDVIVLLVDMTNYCEGLRTISASKWEIPMRQGYPSYLYSDLASIYERCGVIKGKKGSVTVIPILTMPNDDITHIVPDLTGYIVEGQIVFSRNLFNMGIYPSIDIVSSLSRMMRFGVGKGKTREDHFELANQIYSSYSKGIMLEEMSKVIGSTSMTEKERKFIEFKKKVDSEFINQSYEERRDIEKTLDIGWECISILPEEELVLISKEILNSFRKVRRS
jgi:V/A-type H+-transporting ATPase subunit B